ncbi:hypothetical protein XBO1_1940060 [Xenorhabdus bovienii str. oregonense]|uniref:Uncharacterized protein n=1 Tax=Xenorhabdus bovienii str. oregonense TaxID=1398202 RepID=A0A077P413_XENBV|nr:hypothetical protein XBO1_1940060 [Xenorhabdus bovienii str. oregonense]
MKLNSRQIETAKSKIDPINWQMVVDYIWKSPPAVLNTGE